MVVLDKFVAGGERPSVARRMANVVARVVATDLTRKLGPLLHEAGLKAHHDEAAGPGESTRLLRRQDYVSAASLAGASWRR